VTYRFLDHTADVAVELEAASLDELFAEALAAFTDTVTVRERLGGAVERRFEVVAGDLESLLVEWLGEVLVAFEVEGLLLREGEVAVKELGDGRVGLTGVARGEKYEAGRQPIKVLVKGVTYHALKVVRGDDGRWRGRVVFDI
jgi:protein archease